jgi:hypothetical protein
MRHKIWTAVLSVVGLLVILGIAGAVAGSPKTMGSAAAQASNGSPSPQATRSPASGLAWVQAAKKASTAEADACYKRPWTSGDIYVRMIRRGRPPHVRELGGKWEWNHALNKCETSVQMMISTAPMTGGNCTQVGYVADNPGYDPNARPAAPLKKVVALAGPAC